MVDIHTGDVKRFRCGKMIHIPLNAVGISTPIEIKVLGNKLSFLFVFIHDPHLPSQKVGYQLPLELGKLSTQTTVNRSYNRREVFPAIDPITPVIEAKFLVKLIQRAELVPHIFDELQLYIISGRIVMFRLVIRLITDDRWVCAYP
ncbi:hypothetical protein D3C74_381730 [compost metagenome]